MVKFDEIASQIRSARNEESIKLLERNFSNKQKPLAKRVRYLHEMVVDDLEDDMEGDKWQKLFNNEHLRDTISYYRRDCYLLADAPFIFKPTIAIIKNEIDPVYYGTDRDYLKKLAANNCVWLEFLHPKKEYDKNGDAYKLIEELKGSEITPYYANMLEDILANYWINNVLDEEEITASRNKEFNNFLERPMKKTFHDDFLKGPYLKYKKNKNEHLEKLYRHVPEGEVLLPAIKYENLNKSTLERILRVELLKECLDDISNEKDKFLPIESIYEKFRKEGLSSGENRGETSKKIGKFIFKYWQRYGTFWSYSKGGTVDFSMRDLTNKVDPEMERKSSDVRTVPDIPLVSPKLNKLIQETDLDGDLDLKNLDKRKELLDTFLKDVRETREKDPYWMFKIQNVIKECKRSQNLEERQKKINEKIDEVVEQKIPKGLNIAVATGVEFGVGAALGPISSLVLGPGIGVGTKKVLKKGKRMIKYGIQNPLKSDEEKFYPVKLFDEFKNVEVDGYYDEKEKEKYLFRNSPFRFNVQVLNLPYKRSYKKYSNITLDSYGEN